MTRYDNEDEMFDYYANNIFDELYPNEPFVNDEQEEIINNKIKQFIDS